MNISTTLEKIVDVFKSFNVKRPKDLKIWMHLPATPLVRTSRNDSTKAVRACQNPLVIAMSECDHCHSRRMRHFCMMHDIFSKFYRCLCWSLIPFFQKPCAFQDDCSYPEASYAVSFLFVQGKRKFTFPRGTTSTKW